jgi:hypothetical protein
MTLSTHLRDSLLWHSAISQGGMGEGTIAWPPLEVVSIVDLAYGRRAVRERFW